MTRRFYVDAPALAGDTVEIAGPLAHRIAKVLRLCEGDEIMLFDGGGEDVVARIAGIDASGVTATVVERVAGPREPHVKVHLYQSVTKGERFEWLLEKATELGVSCVVPLVAARAVVKASVEGNRMERWRRIVIEAAEQCGRGAVPAVEPPQPFAAALRGAPGIVLLPYEEAGDAAPDIQAVLSASIDELFALGKVSVLIGPEGGYEPAEVDAAREAGAQVVTLGERVLRSETAGLVALTLVMHGVGELG
jgi:16S rRNA (uracil1498-N3)-methyltransferase